MQEHPQSTGSSWSKTWIAIRFIVFGVGGFVALWTGCISLMISFDHISPRDLWSWLGFPVTLVGALMMLFGCGMWKRWAYLWVFLSPAIVLGVLAGLIFFNPNWEGSGLSYGFFLLALISSMPISYWLVRGYYKKREASHPPSTPVQIAQDEGTH
jgi:hypothetical protein